MTTPRSIPTGVWVTKYALSEGILFFAKADFCLDSDSMVEVYPQEQPSGRFVSYHFHRNQYHLSLEAAIERTKVMIKAKQKSLEKQAKKLNNFDFTVNAK